MARPPRVDVGGYAYHVLNRTAGRWRMFRKDGDFEAFERVLELAVERSAGDVRLLTYCLMGNHWHLVLKTQARNRKGTLLLPHSGRQLQRFGCDRRRFRGAGIEVVPKSWTAGRPV